MAILIVDDDDGIQEAMSGLLGEEGYTTAVVRDGFEALLYLQTHPCVELILLDLTMPEMDGAQLRRRLLDNPEWAKIPVVIVSARPDCRTQAKLLGADDCLAKPMHLEELLHVVQNRAKTSV